MDLSDGISIIIGVYAAGLTTYTIIRSIRERKRRLSIDISTGFFPFFDLKVGPQLLIITIKNMGNKKVSVDMPYLELPDGRKLDLPVSPNKNHLVDKLNEEGDSFIVWMKMEKVKCLLREKDCSGKVKLKGKVSDKTGKVYSSKRNFKFDTNMTYD